MAHILIYTADFCSYCSRVKALFKQKGVAFEEINLGSDSKKRKQLEEKSGMRTVPVIFINDQCIGGYVELMQLESEDKLDSLIQKAPLEK